MKKLLCGACRCLKCPFAVFGGILLICVIALATALTSEVLLGLEPCELCIYQRWGFVAAAIFALLGLAMRKKRPLAALMATFSGVAFLINSGVAFYHTGVEQKWWASAVEGCAVPASFAAGDQSWIDNIMSAPSAPCDVIPWQDPFIHLSMANYNIALCLGMFVICLLAALSLRKTQQAA